jgi:hypothetical protein
MLKPFLVKVKSFVSRNKIDVEKEQGARGTWLDDVDEARFSMPTVHNHGA